MKQKIKQKSSFRASDRLKPGNLCKAKFVHAGEITIKNISLGGLLVDTTKRLNVNGSYKIQLASPNIEETITPTCYVMRSFLRGSKNKMPFYEVAFKFTQLNEKEKNFLRRILSEFSKKKR
jgi:hypothetical protein